MKKKFVKQLNGFLNVNKPSGQTSHAVVKTVAKTLKDAVKVGHTGTLDPLATGVLFLCVGKATKLSSFFIHKDKSYETLVKFGISTDSFDTDGKVINERPVTFTKQDLEETLNKFKGEINQTVPRYSAVKVNGERLYNKVRKGAIIENLPSRVVNIKSLEPEFLAKENNDELILHINCSSGTYIRSLVNDIGEDLGCGATVKGLKRTSIEKFKIADSIGLDEIKDPYDVRNNLISIEDALGERIPKATITPEQARGLFSNGHISVPADFSDQPVRIVKLYSSDTEKFIGVGSVACKISHCVITKIIEV